MVHENETEHNQHPSASECPLCHGARRIEIVAVVDYGDYRGIVVDRHYDDCPYCTELPDTAEIATYDELPL